MVPHMLRALGSLRLPSSRSSELAPLLISDTAGCVWNLSKERCIQVRLQRPYYYPHLRSTSVAPVAPEACLPFAHLRTDQVLAICLS